MIKKELLDRTYILTGREIFEFIEKSLFIELDSLDINEFIFWLETKEFFPSEEEINEEG